MEERHLSSVLLSTGVNVHALFVCICLYVFLCMSIYDCMCTPKGGDGRGGQGGMGERRWGGKEQRQSGIIVTDRAAP